MGVHGGPRGDLYIYLNVEEHPFFKREGHNLFCDMPISFPQAALGGEIEVPTLDGSHKLKIPSGTPSGRIFHIKGKGVQKLGGSTRGDQVVRVYIDVPKNLTQRQREILEEFAQLSGDEVNKSFKEKIKNLFIGCYVTRFCLLMMIFFYNRKLIITWGGIIGMCFQIFN